LIGSNKPKVFESDTIVVDSPPGIINASTLSSSEIRRTSWLGTPQ